MDEIIALLNELFNTLRQASLETIVTGIAIFLLLVIAFLWDRAVNGSDASNSFFRHDDNRSDR